MIDIPQIGDRFNAFLEYYVDENGLCQLFMPGQKGYKKVMFGCPCVCTEIHHDYISAVDNNGDSREFFFSSTDLARIVSFEVITDNSKIVQR